MKEKNQVSKRERERENSSHLQYHRETLTIWLRANIWVSDTIQADRKRFRSRCAVQREVLHAVVNKTIYSLLMDQQRALVAAGFPRFSTSIVERIQNTMVALKSSPSSVTATPVTGGRPVSNFDSILLEELSVQKKFVCVLLSLRVNLEPPSSHRFGSGYGRRDSNEGGLMRGSSVGSDYYSGGKNGRSDYYSQDSKLQRKAKRRKVYSADGCEEIRFDDRRMRLDTASSDSRGFEGRRQQQGQSLGYQGPEHLRRGPRRGVRGPMNRNLGGEGGVHNSQNPKGSATFTEKNKSEEAPPINLLQKLATMIQKVKK